MYSLFLMFVMLLSGSEGVALKHFINTIIEAYNTQQTIWTLHSIKHSFFVEKTNCTKKLILNMPCGMGEMLWYFIEGIITLK